MKKRPLKILLVEDDPGHVRLMIEAFKEGTLANHLYVVKDGEEALAYLRRQAPHTEAQRPDLVLLDLNMPKKDGRETLAEIKADPNLKRIPIVILTASQAEGDILHAYDLQANSYITKPVDLDQFTKVVKQIEEFWLTVARLPAGD